MKIALVYNAKRMRCPFNAREISERFAEAGHEVLLAPTESSWDHLMERGIQRVVVAGGDGTVERVLPHLIEWQIPFCILPCGTANNISKSLHQASSLPGIASWIENARELKLDVGIVHQGAFQRDFVEAVGAGLFVQLMKNLERSSDRDAFNRLASLDEKLARIREYLGIVATSADPFDCDLTVEGERISGRFLLVEVMNMRLIGPNLPLAPATDPGDGWFDLVLVGVEERRTLLRYLRDLKRSEYPTLPFECRPCRTVSFEKFPPAIHVDDQVFKSRSAPITVSIRPGALHYLEVARPQAHRDAIWEA